MTREQRDKLVFALLKKETGDKHSLAKPKKKKK
jgi:hypothetical protein